MIKNRSATEDEMISAFLQAEVDSPKWGPCVTKGLAAVGSGRQLVDQPRLNDASENNRRKRVLDHCRGYERRVDIFTGFPLDVMWWQAQLQPGDFATMKYMAHRSWAELSLGTRLVSVGASNFHKCSADQRFTHIASLAEAVRDGVRFEPLIAIQHHDDYLVLVEGHSRATAYVIESFVKSADAFVGASSTMHNWKHY